jgi:C1A family cysteine protease
MKVIAAQGVCPESEWKYDIAKFTKKPTKTCYTHALKHQAIQYYSVNNDLQSLKACLAEGFPVVFGYTVYSSFQRIGADGMMPMPKRGESIEGGHCTVFVGFDDKKKCFLVRNSWGTSFGVAGYFWMPYDFATNPRVVSDCWTLRLVEV